MTRTATRDRRLNSAASAMTFEAAPAAVARGEASPSAAASHTPLDSLPPCLRYAIDAAQRGALLLQALVERGDALLADERAGLPMRLKFPYETALDASTFAEPAGYSSNGVTQCVPADSPGGMLSILSPSRSTRPRRGRRPRARRSSPTILGSEPSHWRWTSGAPPSTSGAAGAMPLPRPRSPACTTAARTRCRPGLWHTSSRLLHRHPKCHAHDGAAPPGLLSTALP